MKGSPCYPLNDGNKAPVFTNVAVGAVTTQDADVVDVKAGLFINEINKCLANRLPSASIDRRLAKIRLAFGITKDVVIINLNRLLISDSLDKIIVQRSKFLTISKYC